MNPFYLKDTHEDRHFLGKGLELSKTGIDTIPAKEFKYILEHTETTNVITGETIEKVEIYKHGTNSSGEETKDIIRRVEVQTQPSNKRKVLSSLEVQDHLPIGVISSLEELRPHLQAILEERVNQL